MTSFLIFFYNYFVTLPKFIYLWLKFSKHGLLNLSIFVPSADQVTRKKEHNKEDKRKEKKWRIGMLLNFLYTIFALFGENMCCAWTSEEWNGYNHVKKNISYIYHYDIQLYCSEVSYHHLERCLSFLLRCVLNYSLSVFSFSWTSRKRPPKILSSLGGRLWEVVT